MLSFLSIGLLKVDASKGKSTELTHDEQVQKDDEILAKDISDLTPEELKRLEKIKAAQVQKRSGYEKRAIKKLANDQPKTYAEYEKMSAELKNSELHDFNPQFKKDPKLVHVPDPEIQIVRYNYPAGSREIDLTQLKTTRHVNSKGVLSPDGKLVVYTDVDYTPGLHKTSSNAYIIPVVQNQTKTQKRMTYLQQKENKLLTLTQEVETNKSLSMQERRQKKEEIKKLNEEVKKLRTQNLVQDQNDALASQNDTPAQTKAKSLMQAHIKDRIKEPILSSGLYDMDFGVQRTLTVVDWSNDSKKILLKEKIAQEGDGLWQTNLWVYDLDTNSAKKLDEIRQAVEYYWNKDRIVDLHYYRFDLYPLGWDAQHKNRILLYVYGYNKQSGAAPKFLGTWSIDAEGKQSQLLSILKTGYIVEANGFCLKTKNMEYYEKTD